MKVSLIFIILITILFVQFVHIILGISFFVISIGFVLYIDWFTKKNILKKQQKRHDSLFSHLPTSKEIPERLAVYDTLHKNDVVLEIGGNIGGVSAVIATILENPSHLVVIEPSKSAVKQLIQLKTIIKKDFNILNGVLISKEQILNCSQPDNDDYCECKEVSTNENRTVLNKTFYEIQDMYDLIFDTLVIDCEGCYENIFKDSIESGWLSQIRKIIIEWDGSFMEQLLLDNGFTLIDTKVHSSLLNGVKTYIK